MDTTTIFCVVVPLLVLFVVAIARMGRQNDTRRALAEAHTAYQDALKALKANPTGSDLRQRALTLGRAYANLTRDKKGVTVYDEMAVMNDLSAATAGATTAVTPPVATSSVEDRLKALDALRAKGVVSEQEFTARRQKILDEL